MPVNAKTKTMAEADINKIFTKGAIKSIDKAIEKMTALEGKTEKALKAAMALNQEIAKTNSLQKANEQLKARNKNISEAKRLNDQYRKTLKQNETMYGNMSRAIQRQNTQRQNARKIIKLEQQALDSQKGSYKQLDAQMRLNIMKLKEMSAAQRTGTKQGKELTATIRRQYNELKRMDKQMGMNFKNVGNYRSAMGGLTKAMGAFGVFLGGAAIVQGFRRLIGLGSAFEKQMSRVAAVSNATGPQMAMLSQQAMVLGANTEKTAKQVGDLQMELAKLGLTAKEITVVTGAILDMATASDAELGQAASVAAKTMKGFGKSAKDMNSIVDVMAKAFSSSALDISKFETAMSDVAPVARSVNKTLERSTAELSVLVDNGLDASKAGTSLRNIMLELAKRGMTWDEALTMMNESTDKSVVALDLFGKRGATAALILSENEDRVKTLTGVYERSAGAASHMADIMRDNLAGDTDKANSAMQGLGITIMDGLNRPIREAIQGFTSFVTAINDSISSVKTQAELIAQEQAEVDTLIRSIMALNAEDENRQTLIDELVVSYPDLIGSIDAESVSNEQLKGILADVNKEYEKRITLAVIQDELSEATAKSIDIQRRQREIVKSVTSYYKQYALEVKEGASLQEMLNTLTDETKLNMVAVARAAADVPDASGAFGIDEMTNGILRNANKLSEEYNQNQTEFIELKEEANRLQDESLLLTGDEASGNSKVTKTVIQRTEAQKRLNNQLAIAQQIQGGSLAGGESELPTELQGREGSPLEDKGALQNAMFYDSLWRQTYKGRLQTLKDMLAEGIIAEAEYSEAVKQLNIERAEQAIGIGGNVASQLMGMYTQTIDNQLQALQYEKEQELALHEGNAEEQAKINEKYAKKEAKLKRKKAVANKTSAIINAVINTALGITNALATGGPAAIALAAIAGALGAIQIGVIASQPIPQFEKGGTQKKSGLAITSEAGREMMIKPSGQLELTGSRGAEMRWLAAGTRIIPNAETEQILKHGQFSANNGAGWLIMQQGLHSIKQAINNKRELIIVPSKSKIIERGNGYYKEYLNSKIN